MQTKSCWKKYKFDDIFTFDGSYSVPRESLGDEGVAYLHYGDMHTSNRKYLDVDSEYQNIPKYKINSEPKFCLNDGDLVFVDASEDYPGTCKTFLIKNKTNKKIVAGLHTFIAREKQKIVCDDFKKYLTENPNIKKQIYKYVQGYKVYGISRENLKSVEVALPDYEESEYIAKILDCWSKAIELQEQKIEKLKLKKKALMQKLLKPKVEWEELVLGNVSNMSAGGTPSTSVLEYWGGEIPWIQSGLVQNNIIKLNDINGRITEEGLTHSAANWIEEDSVLVAITGATCANIGYLTCKATANQSVISIKSKDIYSLFLFYLLQKEKQTLLSLQNGSAQGGLTLKYLQKLTLKAPDKKYQIFVGNLLKYIDDIIEMNVRLLNSYNVQQKALMQKLLTGEIRVNG